MAGRIDQVEVVDRAVLGHIAKRCGLGLDRDASFALEVH